VARNVPAQKRTFFFGIAGAAGTGGQILIAPLNQFTINTFGWDNAFLILAMLLAFILPLAFALKGKSSDNPVANAAAREHTETLWQILQRARRHRGYIFLTAGFFVCGFHVMFIMAHFPNYLKTVDMPVSLAWQAIAVIGFTNLLGTLTFGWLGDKFSKKYLLSILYFMRALVFAVFLVAPKTPTTVLIFSFFLGFLWLATVPLTNALVGHLFGFKYLATLAGIVFMSHQLGSFTSVLLAGWVFDQTGSYDVIWKISIGLGLLSALIHLPIQETPPRAIPQPAE
ncbi:MAG: MFS transporter, partial [Proteobacteria bacterium]|nr:MFS transporter [Pseudomonadota bacterium]